MKKIQLYALMLVLFASCKKKELQSYSGPKNIYFSTGLVPITGWGTDSLSVSFTLTNNLQDSLVKIPVGASGDVSNVDRSYTVKVAAGSTAKEGIHYDFYKEDFKIPAGKLVDSLQVMMHRTPDLKTKAVSLVFQLIADQNFVTQLQDLKLSNGKTSSFSQFRLFSTDILQEPLSWYPFYLGTFSAKKFYLMIQVLQINPMEFSGPAFSNVDFQVVQNYGIAMQRYLNAERLAGRTVYEDPEKTVAMVMGVGAQR